MNIFLRSFRQNWKKASHAGSKYRQKPSYPKPPNLHWAGFLTAFALLQKTPLLLKHTLCSDNDQPSQTTPQTPDEITREEKLRSMNKMFTYEIGVPAEFREGDLREVTVTHEGAPLRLLITRVNGRLFATGACCTYDDKTPLKDGVIFGDKIYCPLHGCAFSAVSGSVEYFPARDHLPIFFASEKNGKVFVSVPKYPPKKVRPPYMFRDFNDLRKVVIIGSGAGAFGCVETLREYGYTGEIKVVSKETVIPYDKTKLSKSFKNFNYEQVNLRPEEFYDELGVELMLGREIKFIDNRHGFPYIELEDGLKLEYDALLISTGIRPDIRDIEGGENKTNKYCLGSVHEHREIKSALDKAKNISIIGANMISLEVAAAIRTEYPNAKVNVIDENDNLSIEDKYGGEVAGALLELHERNGVNFIFQREIEKFTGTETEIKSIVLKDGEKVDTDLVLLFPNNFLGNTEFLLDGENIDSLEFDPDGRLRVEFDMRSDHKRIFAAGDVSSTLYFTTNERMPCEYWNVSEHQGMTAALNMLALDVPFAVIPFHYSKQYSHYFQHSGYMREYNEVYIDGDIDSLDFIAYYAFDDEIHAAFACGNRKRDLLVVNEAMRLQLMPDLDDIREKRETIKTLEKKIRAAKRSGCFKDLLHDIQYDAKPKDVVWINREKSDEYYNFWKQGKTPQGANDLKDNQ